MIAGSKRLPHPSDKAASAVSLNQLPTAITAFLRAAHAHDSSALLGTLTEGAVVTDLGRELRGEALRRWSRDLLAHSRLVVAPLDLTGDGEATLGVLVCGTRPGAKIPVRRQWRLKTAASRIAAIDITAGSEPDLIAPVAALLRAVNARDLEAMMAVFADDAVVNDDLRERRGKAAIRRWAEQDMIGARVAIFAIACTDRHLTSTVTAHVDGDFDQHGLPYPLILTFYLSVADGRIIQLIMLRNQAE
jgi:ketosteroid isomerase-like protein